MGKRGPAAQPSNVVALKTGEAPPPSEPQPSGGEIVPPYPLTKAVQEVWDRLAPDREARGVLTPWDVDAFATFCELIVLHRDALRSARRGVLVRGARKDERVYNRAMQGVRETTQLLTALGGRFGWTPSDRREMVVGGDSRGAGLGSDDLLTGSN